MAITKEEMNVIFPKGMRGTMFASDVQSVVKSLDDLGHLGGGASIPLDTYTTTEVDTLLDTKLDITGGTLTGGLDINGADVITTATLPSPLVAVDPGDAIEIDLASLVDDYNLLLANLRTAGIIA